MTFDPLLFVCSVIALTVAFIVHEYAHALSAYTLGDPTPKYEGRLTLNPLVHLDPIGSAVMLVTMMLKGVVLGWARPVNVNLDNLRGGYFDRGLVAFAGPFANFVLAFLTGMVCHLRLVQTGPAAMLLFCLVKANVGFGLFNCIPWPPLDGWKIVTGMVPRSLGDTMYRLEERVGIYAVIALLLLTPFLVQPVLQPIYFTLVNGLAAGLSP